MKASFPVHQYLALFGKMVRRTEGDGGGVSGGLTGSFFWGGGDGEKAAGAKLKRLRMQSKLCQKNCFKKRHPLDCTPTDCTSSHVRNIKWKLIKGMLVLRGGSGSEPLMAAPTGDSKSSSKRVIPPQGTSVSTCQYKLENFIKDWVLLDA